MAAFTYRAADTTGRIVQGVLDGESEAVALRSLEQQSLTPLTLRRARRTRAAAAVRAETTSIRLPLVLLLEFTRQLKVMLKSGITLLSALGILRATAGTGNYRRLLDRIATDIQSGSTLSEALAAHPHTFDPFYIGTVRAGEAAGIHPEAMDELIRYYERRAALKREVVNALTYPAIVVLALCGASVVMLTWVVPQFAGLFRGMGAELPLPTRVLLGVSGFVTGHIAWLAGGLVALVAGAIMLARVPAARAAFARAAARLPIGGRIVYLATVIQFARMIALLEGAGLPLLETLKIVQAALIPGRVKDLTARICRQVAGGNPIAATVTGTRVLPPLVEHMISVGEATGNIDEMLSAAAAHLEEDMRARIRRLTTALEPFLVLLVSGLVLLLALAIFLPIWELNSLILRS